MEQEAPQMPIPHLADRKPEWEAARLEGMRNSPRIRATLNAIRPAAHEALARARPTLPAISCGPDNCHGISFSLASPDLTHYEGRNLADFIRTHRFLFRPLDVVAHEPTRTRAYAGLYLVVSGRFWTWKGWTRAD